MNKITFAVIISISLFSCNLIKPKNPEFYCKINGKTFIPDKDTSPIGGIGSNPLSITFDKNFGSFSIIARKVPNSLSLFIKLPKNEDLQVKRYELTSDVNGTKGYYTINYAEQNSERLISQNGYFEITRIEGYNVWGTFEFTCKSNSSNTEYKITKGEFNNISYF